MQYFVTFLQNSSGSSGTFREMVGTLAKLGGLGGTYAELG
jgi:hypothetical protein